MVEYLYNAVMATSGDEVVINAYITNENEELITENCNLVIYDGTTNEVIVIVNGLYDTDASVWDFVVSQEITTGLNGRFMYNIEYEGDALSFKQPIYFM